MGSAVRIDVPHFTVREQQQRLFRRHQRLKHAVGGRLHQHRESPGASPDLARVHCGSRRCLGALHLACVPLQPLLVVGRLVQQLHAPEKGHLERQQRAFGRQDEGDAVGILHRLAHGFIELSRVELRGELGFPEAGPLRQGSKLPYTLRQIGIRGVALGRVRRGTQCQSQRAWDPGFHGGGAAGVGSGNRALPSGPTAETYEPPLDPSLSG